MEAINRPPWWHRPLRIAYWVTLVLMLLAIPAPDWIHGMMTALHGTCLVAVILFTTQNSPKWVYVLLLFGVYLIAFGIFEVFRPFL